MSAVSHQTIKLSRGGHRSPQDGACVMELASMLAGEPFSDQPISVCPVIGGFLRSYNDALDDVRRQDLYEYAARIVGSKGSPTVQRLRAERLARWSLQVREPRRRWGLSTCLRSLAASHALWWMLSSSPPLIRWEATDETHAAVLALIDELLAIGACDSAGSHPDASVACGHVAAPM
jgi:hypothetical protein